MKYDNEIADQITNLFATGDHTVADVCKSAGIVESTYYKWKAEKSEFSEAIKKAKKDRLSAFKSMARSGLAKLLTGFEYDEVTTEGKRRKDGSIDTSYVKKTHKVVGPNSTAVIYTLKSLDTENFGDKQQIELSGKDGAPLAMPPLLLSLSPEARLQLLEARRRLRAPEEGAAGE